jgi:hypothetical protein
LDLSKAIWVAKHTDKTVKLPDYADVRRDTLQSVSLFRVVKLGKDKELFKLNRPEGLTGKWKVSWRIRTQLLQGNVYRRFWIIWDRDRDEIHRIWESEAIETAKGWDKLPNAKPIIISKIDET